MDRPAPTPNHPPNRVMPRAYKPLPPAAELWERYDYKPLTGELVLREPRGCLPAGTAVGSLSGNGYLYAGHNGRQVTIHRLIWKWGTGSEPTDQDIDHINQQRTDNRLWNLRAVSRTLNCLNRPGTGYYKEGNRYYARIYSQGNRKRTSLGSYATAEEAKNAYLTAKRELLIYGNKVEKV